MSEATLHPSLYRKKPVEVEAVQWAGDEQGALAIVEWIESMDSRARAEAKEWGIEINTLEGIMCASPKDWIIRGVKGEFYPCKPDIFEATYESIQPDFEKLAEAGHGIIESEGEQVGFTTEPLA